MALDNALGDEAPINQSVERKPETPNRLLATVRAFQSEVKIDDRLNDTRASVPAFRLV